MLQHIVYTYAYNAEKTIERTIRSILSQTVQNWVWYLVDNGATDKTSEIIQKYADMDARIVPLVNRQNNVWEQGNGWWEVIWRHNDSDCFCYLDADDEYKPDFLEKMQRFMADNQLDIAACGHDFIVAPSGYLRSVRALADNLILDTPEKYDMNFPMYHQFMRTMWGKLYSVSVMRKYNSRATPLKGYGGDTRDVTEHFTNAGRIGILAESLHRYYVNPKSASYALDDTRLICDRVLDDTMRAFLVGKCGSVSPQNDLVLLMVYYYGTHDTVRVLLNTQLPTLEKLTHLHEIILSDHTQHLIAWPGYGDQKAKLYEMIFKWLLAQDECRRPEGAQAAAEILSAIYRHLTACTRPDGLAYLLQTQPEIIEPLVHADYASAIHQLERWFRHHNPDVVHLTELEAGLYKALSKPDEELFSLLLEIRQNRPLSAPAIHVDEQIHKLMEQHPMLQNVSTGLAVTLPHVVIQTLKNDYPRALDMFLTDLTASPEMEIADEDAEAYFLLGQNLSAAAENTNAYLYFKKLWISYLLDCSRCNEADEELSEFEQLLPNDEDFRALRSQWTTQTKGR